MPADASQEVAALEAALSALLTSTTTGGARAREARALSRAADDLEVVAAECSNPTTRHALMEQVDAARAAAAEARLQARASVQANRREDLLDGASAPKRQENDTSQAATLAREINEGLRRATAIVSEEVDRSHAAGKVVDESSRRLRMTRDQHSRYGQMLSSGSRTLSDIKRSEMLANVAVIASFVFFFFIAATVASRRLSSSNTATFFVKPTIKVVSAPIRLTMRVFSFLFEKPRIEGMHSEAVDLKATPRGDQFDGGGHASREDEKEELHVLPKQPESSDMHDDTTPGIPGVVNPTPMSSKQHSQCREVDDESFKPKDADTSGSIDETEQTMSGSGETTYDKLATSLSLDEDEQLVQDKEHIHEDL